MLPVTLHARHDLSIPVFLDDGLFLGNPTIRRTRDHVQISGKQDFIALRSGYFAFLSMAWSFGRYFSLIAYAWD